MGAGQIGGIATLLDIDFQNAAEFVGEIANANEASYVVYYLSHALMFCQGSLIEAHVVLTVASCVYGEELRFDVFAGTHTFIEGSGTTREVRHMCLHRGYNHSLRYDECTQDNLALLVLNEQFYFNKREPSTEYMINRIRYGTLDSESQKDDKTASKHNCRYFGWGSRRNGYLVPLSLHLRKVEVSLMARDKCLQMWNPDNKYICMTQPQCKSEKHGALCPDDVGSVLSCSGYLRGIMVSLTIDRPCGVGFVDLTKYHKFLTCGVDDSRDVVNNDDYTLMDYSPAPTPLVAKANIGNLRNTSGDLSK